MKLIVNDWKHAWFESHISERFFQEMAKLERGAVQGLETSAQWMEQIMIEVGTLAQAMIRLEQQGAPEPQIRLAYEKSLRLAALAMHLITALDGTDREQLRSASLVRSEPAEPGPSWGSSLPAPQPRYVPPRPPPAASSSAPAANPAAPAVPRPTMPWRSPLAPSRQERPRSAEKTSPSPASADPGAGGPVLSSGLLDTLSQVSGGLQGRSESQAHQTIVSLEQQGLSRAEIEAVTGEPRHIIEAVLNNARATARGASRTG